MKRKLNFSFKRAENMVLAWDLKKVIKNILILTVLIGFVGIYLWYSRLYMTEERRFWIAINNSMATKSVTRTLETGGTGNTVIQKQQFHFSPQQASRSHVSFSQKSATIDTSVKTEGVSFLDAQYSRYTAFSTNQKKDDGTSPNLDSIIGKWEGTVVEEENREQARLNYVGEMVSLAVFGNFGPSFRADVINKFKSEETYKIENTSKLTDPETKRKLLIVNVSVGLKSYAEQLQNAFIKAGYGEFPALNPDNYDENARIPATFRLDSRNNSIIGIEFGNRQEKYSGYGINLQVEAPQADFSGGELEAIVQEEIGSAL